VLTDIDCGRVEHFIYCMLHRSILLFMMLTRSIFCLYLVPFLYSFFFLFSSSLHFPLFIVIHNFTTLSFTLEHVALPSITPLLCHILPVSFTFAFCHRRIHPPLLNFPLHYFIQRFLYHLLHHFLHHSLDHSLSFSALFREKGSDCWWELDIKDLMPPGPMR
jgi:hypothetical protein